MNDRMNELQIIELRKQCCQLEETKKQDYKKNVGMQILYLKITFIYYSLLTRHTVL